MVSDPLRLNGALDGLVLGGLQIFGVPSPPLYVLANGEQVRDFMYRSDTKVNYLWLLPIDSLCLLPNVFLPNKAMFFLSLPTGSNSDQPGLVHVKGVYSPMGSLMHWSLLPKNHREPWHFSLLLKDQLHFFALSQPSQTRRCTLRYATSLSKNCFVRSSYRQNVTTSIKGSYHFDISCFLPSLNLLLIILCICNIMYIYFLIL